MTDASKTETVIVNGAGPVGLTMACELARHGVDVRIFDKAPEAATQSRALAIFPRTLEVFSAIGILDGVLAEGQRLHAPDLPTQKSLAAAMQLQAFEDAPAMPLGLYYQPVAYRNDLTGMMKGLILFTGVRRA